MYHDKRFQTDINFPFVAFSHEQMKTSTTQSFLLADQKRFGDISQRLMNIDWSTIDDLIKRMENNEYITPQTDTEKNCFQVIKDLDAVSGKMYGSTTSKKYMRSEIWSLINVLGAPYWYITLSPADIHHPICIYYADSKTEFKPDLLPYDTRIRSVCKNPVAGAWIFSLYGGNLYHRCAWIQRTSARALWNYKCLLWYCRTTRTSYTSLTYATVDQG